MSGTPAPTLNPYFFPPDFAEFISRRMRDISANINSVLVGTINSINSNGTVTVSVVFQKVVKGVVALPGGIMGDQIINYPTLVNVPVFVYQGGGAAILMPIAVGDPCILLFCDRDMDTWLETGQVAPPNSDRVHSINDAIAIVGINNLLKPLAITPNGLIQVVDQTGERLPVSGDIKSSMQTVNHSGWLLANGQTIGPVGSGATNAGPQYQLLYTLLGGTWTSGIPLAIPDMRGYTVAGYKSGDANFGTLGAKIGESTHLLTGPESGIQAHNHTTPSGTTGSGGTLGYGNWTPGQQNQATSTTGPTNASTAHNNIQQTFVANWFIKI